LASFQARDDGGVELWITNDKLDKVTDTITIRFGSFVNGTIWEESCPVQAEANSSQVVWRSDAGKITPGSDSYLSVHSTKSLFPANRHFFSPIKELVRTRALPEITIKPNGEHELQVQLRAVSYTYFLHLMVPDERTHFTDNYFDLEAGEWRTIILTNQSITLTPEMVSVGWC
jgi:beta-mannosidase